MDLVHGQRASELFQAQSHLYRHIFNFIGSMSLKCALQLGIPDIIHNHGKPITLPELISALQIHSTKASFVHRLMRLLVHCGFFVTTRVHMNQEEEEEEAYDLTPSSRILLKDNVTNLSPFLLAMLDPVMILHGTSWRVGFEGTKSHHLRVHMGWAYGTMLTKTLTLMIVSIRQWPVILE